MNFRYDFGEKLDLSKFKKQALFYISTQTEVVYSLIVSNFRINVTITTPENGNVHQVLISADEQTRDSNGGITCSKVLQLANDIRFKNNKYVIELFQLNEYSAVFKSNCVQTTVDMLCDLVKLFHKINSLKVFV
jgi:hypothetical protein